MEGERCMRPMADGSKQCFNQQHMRNFKEEYNIEEGSTSDSLTEEKKTSIVNYLIYLKNIYILHR